MSVICRLASRKLNPQFIYYNKPDFIALSRPVTLKAVPHKPSLDTDHDERNLKLGRPTAPHLSIYAIQLTSTLSITHRMTGSLIGGYAFLLGGAALIAPDQLSHYLDAIQVNSTCLFLGKFALAFPFSYHFCNGIRHLIWDLGKLLTLPEVYTSGYIMLGSAVVMTAALMAL